MNRIAIVDDSDINLTLLSALVRRLGDCEPLLFQDSPKGLAWCTDNLPDLVVVDYMMPDLDGIEFVSRLREVAGREGAATGEFADKGTVPLHFLGRGGMLAGVQAVQSVRHAADGG